MTRGGVRAALCWLMAGACLLVGVRPASAVTQWPVSVVAASSGQSAALGPPATPTGLSAACGSVLGNTITLGWQAVTNATSYSIRQSTTASAGPYALVATVTATTWTSGALGIGTYWYEVAANIGAHWISAWSVPSASRSVTVVLCT